MSLKAIPRGLGLPKTTVLISGRKKVERKGKVMYITMPAVSPERWLEVINKFQKG